MKYSVRKVLYLTYPIYIVITLSCTLMTGCMHYDPKKGYWKQTKFPSAFDILLESLCLERQDLGIKKALPVNDPFLLKKVPLFLQSPMKIIPFSQQCIKAFNTNSNSLTSIISNAAHILEIETDAAQPGKRSSFQYGELKESPLKDAVEMIYQGLEAAQGEYKKAFTALKPDEVVFVKNMIEKMILSSMGENKLPQYKVQQQIEKTFYLASKIDRKKIIEASIILASSVDRGLNILRKENPAHLEAALKKNTEEDTLTIHTPLGEIIIGGRSNNHYAGKMPIILIDLGGDDDYCFDDYSPFSVIIDLSGNDVYHSTRKSMLGSGIMGIGFLIDLEGNDQYYGENFSFGSGLLGVGVVLDAKGNDQYTIGVFSQGAGALGLGILCDKEGDDVYKSTLYSQGFGYVGGGGFLLDYKGNDRYITEGVVPDFREKAGAYQSCSQGFAIGCRPFAAGGVGILYDKEGDDRYEGSYFCQGSSYYLSLGMLIDGDGNDRYLARRYAQGAGTHYSVGALIDMAGNDTYQSWGVSQGCGHDFSVGMLYDKSGNDTYHGEFLCQGAGNDSGIGILIDEYGDDQYEAQTSSQGDANFDARRNALSFGFLVDGGGNDRFSILKNKTQIWKKGRLGGGIDYHGDLPTMWFEKFNAKQTKGFAHIEKKEPLTEENWDRLILPELEGSLLTEDSWKDAAQKLFKRGPAVFPSLLKYLEIKDVCVRRTVEDAFKLIGEKHLEQLHSLIEKENTTKEQKRFLLYILGDIGNTASKNIFLKFLNDENSTIQAVALRGLYKLKASLPMEMANHLAKSGDADVRRYLCLSLQASKKPDVLPVLINLLQDSDCNTRLAALEAIKLQGEKAVPFLKDKWEVQYNIPR